MIDDFNFSKSFYRQQWFFRDPQLEIRLEKAFRRVDKKKWDVRAKGIDTALSTGATIFTALSGRKALSVSNANHTIHSARGAGRVLKEQGDVQRAEDAVVLSREDVDILTRELLKTVSALTVSFDLKNYELETVNIPPATATFISWKCV